MTASLKVDTLNPGISRKGRLKFLAPVFFLLLGCYLFTLQGIPLNGDPETMFYVAHNIAHGGGVALQEHPDLPLEPGRNAAYYSKFGIAQTLIELPGVWLASRAGAGLDEQYGYSLGYYLEFLAGVASVPVVSALAAIVFALLLMEFGAGARTAAALAIVYGFCTPAWVYSKFGFSEALQTLLLLSAALFAVRSARGGPALKNAVFAGLAAGLLFATKAILVVVLPFFIGYVYFAGRKTDAGWRKERLAGAAAFCAALAPGVALALWYNLARFGSVLDFGYGSGPDAWFGFSTPLLSGLYGLLFSPGKSVFLYAPLIVAGLAGAAAFHRKHGAESLLFWGISAALIVVYSKWWAWHGDWAWGPRFLVPCVPLALIPALGLLEWRGAARAVAAAALCALAVFSFWIQILGVTVNYNDYIDIVSHTTAGNPFFVDGSRSLRDGNLPTHFVPEFSPVAGHAWLLKHRIIGKEDDERTAAASPWRHLDRAETPAIPPQAAASFDFWHEYFSRGDFFPDSAAFEGRARAALLFWIVVSLLWTGAAFFRKTNPGRGLT